MEIKNPRTRWVIGAAAAALVVGGLAVGVPVVAQAASGAPSVSPSQDTPGDGESADDQGVEDGTADGESADDQNDTEVNDGQDVEDGTADGETGDDAPAATTAP